MTVLLIGRDSDLHLDSVVLALLVRHEPFVRLDPERITPGNTSVSWSGDHLVVNSYDGSFDPRVLKGVLCRYALESMRTESTDPVHRFVFDEFWTALRSALLCVPRSRWINDPFAEAVADHKPLQTALAAQLNLSVPATIVSQHCAELAEFSDRQGRCVIKPLSDTGLARQGGAFVNEVDPGSVSLTQASFTTRFDPSTLRDRGDRLDCPVMLQSEVRKDFDLRVTVVDGSVFAAKLTRKEGCQPLDIRNAEDVQVTRYEPFTPRSELIALISKLGLRFASCDFVVAQGEHFFLEANASGNWLWTQNAADLPIGEAIANALCGTNTIG